jgi:hypothetical protein
MRQYFTLSGFAMVTSFALAWVWVVAMPMRFMEPEYAAWRAKLVMLDRCDLGDTIVLGDSRAAADIMPVRLPFAATNLAIGGGEAIEALALLRRAVSCPNPPWRLILSFDAGHFSRPDLFWERSVRFGFLSTSDIAELRLVSIATGDMSIYEERHADRMPSRLRDWLYLARFPVYDFASLLHGAGFLRGSRNQRMLDATLAQRGQYSFGIASGSHDIAVEGHLGGFKPLPVLDYYFRAILDLADRHGMQVLFLPMPINQTTYDRIDPALRRGFAAYLQGYADRYPRFQVAGDIIPHRPDASFGDQFCHMNPEAAERFSDELAQRLLAEPPSPLRDAHYGWFNARAVSVRDGSRKPL